MKGILRVQRVSQYEMGFFLNVRRGSGSEEENNLLFVVSSFNHVNHEEEALLEGEHDSTCLAEAHPQT